MIGNHAEDILKKKVLTAVRKTYITRDIAAVRTFHDSRHIVVGEVEHAA